MGWKQKRKKCVSSLDALRTSTYTMMLGGRPPLTAPLLKNLFAEAQRGLSIFAHILGSVSDLVQRPEIFFQTPRGRLFP